MLRFRQAIWAYLRIKYKIIIKVIINSVPEIAHDILANKVEINKFRSNQIITTMDMLKNIWVQKNFILRIGLLSELARMKSRFYREIFSALLKTENNWWTFIKC